MDTLDVSMILLRKMIENCGKSYVKGFNSAHGNTSL